MSVELKPIKTKKIYEEIVEQIIKLIQEGQLKPGDKLPPERDLVKSFNVSRASIREALSALQIMGLLDVRTGEGTYICNAKSESGGAPFHWVFPREKTITNEIFEVRKILEVQTAGFAAERATEEEILELGLIHETMKKDFTESGIIREELDYDFHYQILKSTHNRITASIIDTIEEQFQMLNSIEKAKYHQDYHLAKQIIVEHQKIYYAIKMRDAVKSKASMLKHLSTIEKYLKD